MKIVSLVILVLVQIIQSQFCEAQDWPGFGRYHDSNEVLKAAPRSGDRVVFMGNSITDFWIKASPDFFEQHHYIDRGISGQTSPQMLVRFRADVISLKPKAVVLLCGTNDIAGNTGPSTLEMIEDNIVSMAELARANGIRVVLCSVLPASAFPWKPEVHPAEKIIALNQWIKKYAEEHEMIYLDYYSSLVDDKGGMKPDYSKDGVHPNKAGYQVMEDLAEPVIEKAIRSK
jgi:lysophospholipase L1-like esterase